MCQTGDTLFTITPANPNTPQNKRDPTSLWAKAALFEDTAKACKQMSLWLTTGRVALINN
jgi:hypothetical protein